MVTLAARLAALEQARRIGEAWNVIAEAWGDGDDEAIYTVCSRWPGEASRELTPEEYRRFAADHPVRVLRIYCRGHRENAGL